MPEQSNGTRGRSICGNSHLFILSIFIGFYKSKSEDGMERIFV